MTFYQEMQGVATEILDEFQQGDVLAVRTTPGTPDPTKPWEPVEGTVKTYKLKATVRGVSQKYLDGTNITVSDQMVVAAVAAKEVLNGIPQGDEAFHPAASDEIRVDGKTRSVKRIIPIPAAGTPVAYHIVIGG
jgi:hypothetical protein